MLPARDGKPARPSATPPRKARITLKDRDAEQLTPWAIGSNTGKMLSTVRKTSSAPLTEREFRLIKKKRPLKDRRNPRHLVLPPHRAKTGRVGGPGWVI